MTTTNGLVAFLDILGYQQIVDNNEVERVAVLLTDTIHTLPEVVCEELASSAPSSGYNASFSSAAKQINFQFISDAIVASLPFDSDTPPLERYMKWMVFTGVMAKLLRLSFEAGLPLRGAIDYGQYYVSGNSFAGKPFVNAYRTSNSIRLSGCALSPAALADAMAVAPEAGERGKLFLSRIFVPFLVPTKEHGETKMILLNWLNPFAEWGHDPSDIDGYLYKSFYAHSKDIGASAQVILDTTKKFLMHVKLFR